MYKVNTSYFLAFHKNVQVSRLLICNSHMYIYTRVFVFTYILWIYSGPTLVWNLVADYKQNVKYFVRD